MRSLNFFSAKGAFAPLLAIAALLLPSAAMAQNMMPGPGGASTWSVYAFGNAQAVSDAFRAINNFSSSSTFQDLVGLIALVGIVVMALTSGFNAATAKRLIGYCVGVFLVVYVFFGVGNGGPLTVRVEVFDTVDGTWKAPVNVPAVVGIPAAVVSTAGQEITRQIEASFPLPDDMKLTNGAPFNMAASMIQDASKARITDPNLSSSLAYYVQDCFTMGVSTGAISPSVLVTSTNFLDDIKYKHPGVMVNTLLEPGSLGVDQVASCETAWGYIDKYIKDLGPGVENFMSSASAWTGTTAFSVLNAGMDAVAQYSTNNGITSGGGMVKQAAMLSAFTGAYRQAAAATGNSDFLTGLSLNQAYQAQTTGWIVGAEVFNRIMGYIFAVIQVFVYAITPFVLAAALIPGLGFALLKNFLQITLWLAIWQPMLAIVNFIVVSMQQSELGGALAVSGGHGFTLTNMGLISEKTANLRAAAAFVGTMVPALAWALVKGSVDFSRVIGSAVGENFAQSASNTMTTGNYSLNQASMDSFTANKHSIAHSSAQGEGFSSAGSVMNRKLDAGGTNPAVLGGQSAMTNVAATSNVNDAGTLGDTSNVTQAGSRAKGITDTHQTGTSVNETDNAARVLASQKATSVQGGGSASAGVGTKLFESPNAASGGKATAPGGGMALPSNQLTAVPGNREGGGIGKYLPTTDLRAGLSGSGNVSGIQSEGNQQQHAFGLQKTAAEGAAASDARQASDTAANAKSAGNTGGWSEQRSVTISAPGSLWERALVANQTMQMNNPFFSSGGPVQADLHAMTQSQAVPNMVNARKQEVNEAKGDYDETKDKLRGDAKAGFKKLVGEADGQINDVSTKAKNEDPAKVSASARAGESIIKVANSVFGRDSDSEKSTAPKPTENAPATPAAQAPAQTVAQAPAQAPAQTVAQAPAAQAPAQTVTQAPAAQAPAQTVAHAPAAQAPAQAVALAAAAQAPAQTVAQAPAQKGSDQAPGQGNQQPGSAVPQVQLAQLPPLPPLPPVQQPPLPSVPQAQLAQAPLPEAPTGNAQQLASLDPMNQPKPAVTEDQVRNAQQQSERLEQHRRNADNILVASADATQVQDLQDAIRNARDYTGRA